MSNDPFRVPDDEPNPFALQRETVADPVLNPYAPTANVGDTEGYESDVESFRRQYLTHEASIQSVGILYLIPGILFLVLFAVGIVMIFVDMVNGNGAAGRQGRDVGFAVFLSLVYGLLGAAQCYTGWGLRRFDPIARRIAIVFSTFGLLAFPFGTLINAYILYLLLSVKGKTVFSDAYQDAIRQTPHIKYRTSLIVKIFLGLLLVVIGFALVAVFTGV